MPFGPDPCLSVVVIGYAPADLLGRCLAELRSQAAERTDVEVLVVAQRSHQGSVLTPLRDQFPGFSWIEASSAHNVARMRGLGIARSRAPVVALLEGDCLPTEDWLARAAQSDPEAALGGAVEPGAFAHAVDWAAYFCEFARYMLPLPPHTAQLPGANVLYRRQRLPNPGRLETEGFYETFVNATIAGGAGHPTDAALVVRHQRTWATAVIVATRFHHGRGFAALRTQGKSQLQRVPFMVLAVALPFVLVARVLAEPLKRRRHMGRALLALPWIIALSFSWGLGELAGYAAGAGKSLDQWR